MINVLEHIDDDKGFLDDLPERIRPNGHLLNFVPALQFLYSDLDCRVGHHRRYHLANLRAIVQSVGFDVRSARYFDFAGIAPWLIINKLLRAKSFSRRAVGLYDKFAVPISRNFEAVVPIPIEKTSFWSLVSSPELPGISDGLICIFSCRISSKHFKSPSKNFPIARSLSHCGTMAAGNYRFL